MKRYIKQTAPYVVPTSDNKLIEEHVGLAATGDKNFSVAHMIAPPFWSEPHQNPEFDEITLLVKGRKMVEVDGEKIVLKAGESIVVKRGARVQYSNPFPEPNEYWAICVPAFSMETVNREDGDLNI
jgi:mannose-6-phosphate isomerase-like protein (cupin superfamily)